MFKYFSIIICIFLVTLDLTMQKHIVFMMSLIVSFFEQYDDYTFYMYVIVWLSISYCRSFFFSKNELYLFLVYIVVCFIF